MLRCINSCLLPENKRGTTSISLSPHWECKESSNNIFKAEVKYLHPPPLSTVYTFNTSKAALFLQNTPSRVWKRQKKQNLSLEQPCSFKPFKGLKPIPSSSIYIWFHQILLNQCVSVSGHTAAAGIALHSEREGLLRLWAGLGQAWLSDTARQRHICQTFPRSNGEDRGQRRKLGQPLPLPFIRCIRRNEPPSLGERWKCNHGIIE